MLQKAAVLPAEACQTLCQAGPCGILNMEFGSGFRGLGFEFALGLTFRALGVEF